MSAINFQRSVNLPNPLPNLEVTGRDGTEQGIGNYCKGQRLLLRCRFADVYTEGAAFAPDTKYNFEGPYLRIRPTQNTLNPPSQVRAVSAEAGNATYSNTVGANTTLPDPNGELFYEVDAHNCSLYLPFAASLSLYTDFAGQWVFDVWQLEDWEERPDPFVNTLTNANLKQTRNVMGGNGVRKLVVPVGAHAVQFAGDNTTSSTIDLSDTSKTVGVNSDFLQNCAPGQVTWPYAPGALGNARVIRATPGAADHDMAVIFGIAIP